MRKRITVELAIPESKDYWGEYWEIKGSGKCGLCRRECNRLWEIPPEVKRAWVVVSTAPLRDAWVVHLRRGAFPFPGLLWQMKGESRWHYFTQYTQKWITKHLDIPMGVTTYHVRFEYEC